MAKIKRKKKVVAKTGVMNKTEAENSQLELFNVLSTKRALEKREKELKERLGEYMNSHLKTDDKGHRLLTTLDNEGNKVHLQRQARKSVKLNQERTIEFLLENGFEDIIQEEEIIAPEVTTDQIIDVLIKHAPDFIIKQDKVDELLLEQAVTEERISMTQFESLCDITVTYAMTFIDDKILQQEKE